MLKVFSIGWLSATVLAQADGTLMNRIPLWAIGLVVLLIIIFAVVWTLYEEEEAGQMAGLTVIEPEIQVMTAVELAASPPDPSSLPTDDLTVIEGIGPKIASLLQAEGIVTFSQLAATEVESLREIMLRAKLRIANPETWPEQAALAAAGNWSALTILQKNLKGGRRI